MALVSRSIFAEQARGKGVGDVWSTDRYVSRNAGLRPLSEGGALFLVTVRPPDERLWLVAVLEAPRFDGERWVAAPNVVPIADVTDRMAKLVFSTGKGVSAEPGKLGMSLQTPRALTEADVGLLRVGVLKQAVLSMPALRVAPRTPRSFATGAALYDTAVKLYAADLPVGEADLIALLETSTHSCGHGGDVAPPLDLAIRHATEHGLSPGLAAAIRQYVAGLKGLTSVTANHLKRKAALLLVVDPSAPPGPACWSDRLRMGLASLPPAHRAAWQRWVLGLKPTDHVVPGKDWTKRAKALITAVGRDDVIASLGAWLPDPAETPIWPIQTGGSNVLKQLVWLLDLIEDPLATDPLARRLAFTSWKSPDRAEKVAVATAYYLSRRPPEVARDALQALKRASDAIPKEKRGSDRIDEVFVEYSRRHAT